MQRIGFVLPGEVSVSPFLAQYVEAASKKGELTIICWKPRDNSGVYKNPDGCIEFPIKGRPKNKIGKFLAYWRFRLFVTRIIKEKSFDKLLFLTTPAAVLLPKRIFKTYANNYLFDYRDATYEYISWYRKKVDFIVAHSQFTSISSEGFQRILQPSSKIVLCHNTQSYSVTKTAPTAPLVSKARFRLVTFGVVRDLGALLGLFDDDPRFDYQIFGVISENDKAALDNLHKSGKSLNITYGGSYTPDQIPVILGECDAVVYYYSSTFNFDVAVGNRFYQSIRWAKPMIVNPALFCGQLVLKNELGCPINKNDIVASRNNVAAYLRSFDPLSFAERCQRVLSEVERDNQHWQELVNLFFEEKKTS